MWALLAPVLAFVLSGMAVRIILALGVGVTVMTGVSVLFSSLESELVSRVGALPQSLLQLAFLMQVDTAIAILFGAITVRLSLQLVNGALRRVTMGGA